MKKLIYGAILAILIFSSIAVLILYYSQPFTANLNIKKQISYSSIEIQTSQSYYDNQTNLNSAKAEIGTLELENKGYFTKVYSLPILVGCININDGIDGKSVLLNQGQFAIEYRGDATAFYPSTEIEIPVSSKKSYNLIGNYNGYNIPISQFSRANIKSVSIYSLEREERNILSTRYSYYNNYGADCISLKSNTEPVAVILIE